MKGNELVWAFDLGKASLGEAVRQGNKFPHKASLLISSDSRNHEAVDSDIEELESRQNR